MSTKFLKPQLLVAFGAAVRRRRLAAGFSQEAFADACVIDRSYMGGVERGERNLSLLNIGRILDGLEVQPSEFFRELDADRRKDTLTKSKSVKERGALNAKHTEVMPVKSARKSRDTL